MDAKRIDLYGEQLGLDDRPSPNAVRFLNNVKTWTSNIDTLDSARYLQLRFSFLSNVDTGLAPELAALGLAFSFD